MRFGDLWALVRVVEDGNGEEGEETGGMRKELGEPWARVAAMEGIGRTMLCCTTW